MEEKGVDISGLDQDNQIFIPLNTYLRRFVNKEYISNISVQVIGETSLAPAKTRDRRDTAAKTQNSELIRSMTSPSST